MVAPLLFLLAAAAAPQPPREQAPITSVLDDWHDAAAKADEARYFGHLTEDSVFLGTDATERWDKAAFQAYAHPYFAKGKAWTFQATRRNVTLHPSGTTAWFDEELATPNLGPARGSGVLVKSGGRWRIAQYNLSVPIPNELMKVVQAQIEAHLRKKK